MRASPEVWSQLATQYDTAWAETDAAFEAYDRLPVTPETTPEEERYERLRDLALECEDRLLAVVAPDLAGVALQLRILGSRHFSADLADAPMPNKDQDADGLRNIYAAVTSAFGEGVGTAG